MDCTFREIQTAMKYIDLRIHNEFALQASLHGVRVPIRNAGISADDHGNFSEEEQAAADAHMRMRMNQRWPSQKRKGRTL